MNSFNEMFPLARMFPLPVMHRGMGGGGGGRSLKTEIEV